MLIQGLVEAGGMAVDEWPGSWGMGVVEAVAGEGIEMQVAFDELCLRLGDKLRGSNPVLVAVTGIAGDRMEVLGRWEGSWVAGPQDGPLVSRIRRFLVPGGGHM